MPAIPFRKCELLLQEAGLCFEEYELTDQIEASLVECFRRPAASAALRGRCAGRTAVFHAPDTTVGGCT